MGKIKKVIWRPKVAPKEKTISFGSNKSNLETERFRENSGSSEQNDQYYEGSGAFGM